MAWRSRDYVTGSPRVFVLEDWRPAHDRLGDRPDPLRRFAGDCASIVATVPGTRAIWDIHMDGNKLYLGRHGAGVSLLDISDPRSPRQVGFFNDGGKAYGASGAGDHLYVADLQDSVEVLNVREPGAPREIADQEGYAPHAAFFDGSHVYLADQDKGLVILEAHRERQSRLLAARWQASDSSSAQRTP